MPRIAGVDIPDRKKILFSLQYVHGIGPKVAAKWTPKEQDVYQCGAWELQRQNPC